MEKNEVSGPVPQRPAEKTRRTRTFALLLILGAAVYSLNTFKASISLDHGAVFSKGKCGNFIENKCSAYGCFPRPDDPFRFLPCTDATLPPPIEDQNHNETWNALFDPDPSHWSWGNGTTSESDEYAERGIYMCGYLDVPLDYTNASDPRIARLAVTKYQVSGLAPVDHSADSARGHKSVRTIIVEPGGPGGSGTSTVWNRAEEVTKRFSDGAFDVLGWDPRGVNTTLPSLACFPYDADRDRWALLTQQDRYVSSSPRAQLELADAMNNATFAACKKIVGDLPRFVSTAFVARDVERIRTALDEPEVTGYFVSYGTGIGQTYANMFPDRIGRLILDGTQYVRDQRELGGVGWTSLDNVTDAWNDGFLGECLAAGPEHCALAQPHEDSDKLITLASLQGRMSALLDSLAVRPMPGYTTMSGPSLVTHSGIIYAIYGSLYNARSWPALAQALWELEKGNATLAATLLDRSEWEFDPPSACPTRPNRPSTDELTAAVVCADSYDAPQPPFEGDGEDGLAWWSSLWHSMTKQSWISGDSRFYMVLPCRHFTTHFGSAAEVYRGDLNSTLSHPVLLIAETYDPATPLRNGRRLLDEMGDNARLIVHHGYGHSSRDTSNCTDEIVRAFILEGEIPKARQTACYANEKPYLYGSSSNASKAKDSSHGELLEVWREHMRDLAISYPRLGRP